jgi:hypothetical protein
MTLDQDPRVQAVQDPQVPTAAERERMVGLIKEFREIMITLPKTTRKPKKDRDKTIARLQEIKNEMLHYKMRYPHG